MFSLLSEKCMKACTKVHTFEGLKKSKRKIQLNCNEEDPLRHFKHNILV